MSRVTSYIYRLSFVSCPDIRYVYEEAWNCTGIEVGRLVKVFFFFFVISFFFKKKNHLFIIIS